MNSLIILKNLGQTLAQCSLRNLRNSKTYYTFNYQRTLNVSNQNRNFRTTPIFGQNEKLNTEISKYKDEFKCIYKFKYINQLRLFSRMKIYQTAVSISFGVGSLVMYQMEYVDSLNTILIVNSSMLFALIMLYVISRQTIKIVGRMYVNDDASRVLISHLNFFGKRRDLEVDANLIQPIHSLDELKEKFLKLKLQDMNGAMYISMRYGYFYDRKEFLKVFKVNLPTRKSDT